MSSFSPLRRFYPARRAQIRDAQEAAMRQMSWVAIAVVVLAGTGMRAGTGRGQGNGRGGEEPNGHACTVATLEGAYGLQFQGTRPVRPPFPPGIESFIGVAIRTYDGQGQFTQISNVHGSVIGVEADVESVGTYLVNEDCTGSHSAQFVPTAPLVTDRFVITDNGREVRFAVMTPLSTMNSGELQKIHVRP
jgi:hypothetical protein